MKYILALIGFAAIFTLGLIQIDWQFSRPIEPNQAGRSSVFVTTTTGIEKQTAGSKPQPTQYPTPAELERFEFGMPEEKLPVTALDVISSERIGEESRGTDWQHRRHLSTFIDQVENGVSGEIAGVYVPDVFSLPVLQQPTGQASFVSEQDDTVTQFASPSQYGVVGLLAHNFLSGERFFELTIGQEFVLVYGDRQVQFFRVERIEQFQALTPTSPYSNFIDLADADEEVISSSALFQQIYTTKGQVVFQTCIEAFDDPSWGRIFVIAEPIEPLAGDL